MNGQLENPRLSVIAPAYNEASNLPEFVHRVFDLFSWRNIQGELIVIDDGSTDSTPAVLRQLSKEFSNLVMLRNEHNKGIAYSWQAGLDVARGEFSSIIDSDLQYQPEDIWRLFSELEFSQADIAQGHRSAIGRERDSRYWFSRGLNSILNFLFSMRLKDNKSGFLLGRTEVLRDILRHRFTYNYFQSFIMVSAATRGYSVREVEVVFLKRLAGKSFLSGFPLKVIALTFIDLIKAWWEFGFIRKRDGFVSETISRHIQKAPKTETKMWRKSLFGFYCSTMPLHKWQITWAAADYYKDLKQSQWLPAEGLRELQEKKLRALVHHAYYHVEYYREQFRKLGLQPGDIRTLDDLVHLPLLSKDDVRSNLYHGMLSNNHRNDEMLQVRTSGSTGEPFVCYADRHQLEIRWAATLRGMEMTGWRFGDPQVRLWHQTIGMTRSQIIREQIDRLFCRRLFIPAFEITEHNITALLEEIRTFNPTLIDGYAECLHLIASHMSGKSLKVPRLRAIISSAQMLPEHSRSIIEKAFECPVFDKYGSREFSGIAWECTAHLGHHVDAESYVVEILKDGKKVKPGEMGEVIVTDLNNYCMPFIRYRIGDIARAMDPDDTCPCGRASTKIGQIEGRIQSMIYGANGECVPGSFFLHLFKDYGHIMARYQVVQERRGEITLRIVRGPRFDSGQFSQIVEILKKFLGNGTEIQLSFVDDIPLGMTGKRQAVISKLNLDFQQGN